MSEGEHVVEMQRRRLLTATVEVVYERGVQALTVAVICERAGISRRTFYEIFDGRDECLSVAFEDAVAHAAEVARLAVDGRERWCERMRVGLTALLELLSDEPAVGRLLIVDALGAGEQTLNARKHVLARVIALVDEGRTEVNAQRVAPPLTAEGVLGAVLSVIHARMLEREPRDLARLAGPLMAMIVHPYLGPVAAQKELDRPLTIERPSAPRLPVDPFKDLPIRLTYRTARVLSSIAATPGASSKQVADASGISDNGQISRLLTRLQSHELIEDSGIGPGRGMPRAWSLTERGEGVLQAVGRG